MVNPRIHDLERAVSTALRALLKHRSTENYTQAAERIVALRKAHEHDGLPDWGGRSTDYRTRIERLFRKAAVPPDSEDNLQGLLRYHVGNVIREAAPEEQLVALGLKVAGPRKRMREYKDHLKALATEPESPEALAQVALTALRQLRRMDPENNGIRDALLKVIQEATAALSGLP